MKKNIIYFICFLFVLSISCKKKRKDEPIPSNPETPPVTTVEKKRVTLIDELTVYNIKTFDNVNKPFTLYNFVNQDFMKTREDSFDLAFYTWIVKDTNNKDIVYYTLCSPSYSALRLDFKDEIKYKTRKTVFYLPNSPQSFYKRIFDTIQYSESLPAMIKERFTKYYNPETSEEGYLLQKQTPFLNGTFIAFKTYTGRYGIMRVTSDGNTAQDKFVKVEIKYDK